jgi:hypothetical protein
MKKIIFHRTTSPKGPCVIVETIDAEGRQSFEDLYGVTPDQVLQALAFLGWSTHAAPYTSEQVREFGLGPNHLHQHYAGIAVK